MLAHELSSKGTAATAEIYSKSNIVVCLFKDHGDIN